MKRKKLAKPFLVTTELREYHKAKQCKQKMAVDSIAYNCSYRKSLRKAGLLRPLTIAKDLQKQNNGKALLCNGEGLISGSGISSEPRPVQKRQRCQIELTNLIGQHHVDHISTAAFMLNSRDSILVLINT